MFKIIFINNKENSYYAIVREYKFELFDSYEIIKCFENMSEAKDFLFEMNLLYKEVLDSKKNTTM